MICRQHCEKSTGGPREFPTRVKSNGIEFTIYITQVDCERGSKKDPRRCAAALALKRDTACDESRVHLACTYLRFGDKWPRYTTRQRSKRKSFLSTVAVVFTRAIALAGFVWRMEHPTFPFMSGRKSLFWEGNPLNGDIQAACLLDHRPARDEARHKSRKYAELPELLAAVRLKRSTMTFHSQRTTLRTSKGCRVERAG
jgi:hypothetical protein